MVQKIISKEVLKKIQLVVFDLDGTLLNNQNQIGEETIELVKKLKTKGVKFSFASGRLHSAFIDHANTLNLTTPLISLDGSLIKNYQNGKTIYESYIPEKYVRKAISLADKFLLKIALCHGEAIYYTEHDSLIPKMLEKFGAIYEEVPSYENYMNKTLEIVITGDYKDSVNFVRKKMDFPYSMGLNQSFFKSHSHDDIYYLEIRKKGSTKGKGFRRLTKYMGLKQTQAAVMGDWYNDRTLFETDALKIAVANAVPEIKKLADFITKRTNNEDATAEFLKKLLESKE